MGACEFDVEVRAPTIREAFQQAVANARYGSGSDGYSGTIAEKYDFIELVKPDGMKSRAFVDKTWEYAEGKVDGISPEVLPVIKRAAEIANDKWGACVGFKVKDGIFAFFGLAPE